MKAIKIGLAIVVIGAIAFFVIKSLGSTNELEEVLPPQNAFVERIQNEIDSIKAQPDSEFNKSIYNDITYLIDDHYKPHPPQYPYGRLGDTQWENDQQKKNLSRNLYSAYVNKFLEQAFYVFKNKEWNSADLAFIRSEYKELQDSPYLESGNPINSKFGEIKGIFDKYDEVNRFISSCNNLSYPNEPSLNDKFPINDVRSNLDQAKTYRNTKLGNSYLNNCQRLHIALNAIPQTLYDKHYKYLDNKINHWSGMYVGYNSQKAYTDNLFTPLKNEIELLDNSLYQITDLSQNRYDRLIAKWNKDANSAYDNFSSNQNAPKSNISKSNKI